MERSKLVEEDPQWNNVCGMILLPPLNSAERVAVESQLPSDESDKIHQFGKIYWSFMIEEANRFLVGEKLNGNNEWTSLQLLSLPLTLTISTSAASIITIVDDGERMKAEYIDRCSLISEQRSMRFVIFDLRIMVRWLERTIKKCGNYWFHWVNLHVSLLRWLSR